MDILNKIESKILKIERLIIIVFSFIMVASVFYQVLSRYVLKISIPWTEESSIISFIIMTLYSSIYASYHHRHLGINQLVNRLSEKGYTFTWIVKNIIISIFLINVLIINFLPMLFESLKQSYTVTRIPFFYVFVNIPILALLICFHLILSFLRKDYLKEYHTAKES